MENEVKNVGKKTIIYGIIGILLCVIVILGILVFVAMGRSTQLSKKNKEYVSQMKEMEKEAAKKEQEIGEHQSAADELKKKNEELSETIAGYETQLASVEELNAKINELLTEHEKAKGEVESLKQQVAAVTAEKEELSKKLKDMEADIAEGIVYWVDDGNAYHTSPKCPMISGTENIRSGSIADSGKNAACIFCG